MSRKRSANAVLRAFLDTMWNGQSGVID